MATNDLAVFANLAESLADIEGVTETVDQIISHAVYNVGAGALFGGITLLSSRGRRFETVGATHATVIEADRLQYELHEGPCFDAATESIIVVSAFLATDTRWPLWGPRASAIGFNSVLCAELHSRGRRIGALNLYGVEEEAFSREDMALAALFARQGALALGYARGAEGLREALDTRTIIGQAQGILMERFDIDADRAFATLRRYSQHHNIKLGVFCAHLIETRALPSQDGSSVGDAPSPDT